MTTSRLGAVIDALVTTFQAVDGLDESNVFDGLPVVSSAPDLFVIVGGTPDPDGETGTVTHEWAGLGANARNEVGQVTVTVVSQSGGTVLKTERDLALATLGELEDAIVADPTLGGVITAGQFQASSSTLSQAQTENGARAEITVTVAYTARI